MAELLAAVDADAVFRAIDAISDDATASRDDKRHQLDNIATIAGNLAAEMSRLQSRARASRNQLASGAARLSLEAITNIMLFLPAHPVIYLLWASRVCRRWYEASQHPRVWSNICVEVHTRRTNFFPTVPADSERPHCQHDLRELGTVHSTVHRLKPLLQRTASASVHVRLAADAHHATALDMIETVKEVREWIRSSQRVVKYVYPSELAAMFPHGAKANPLADFLLHVAGAADRLVSLELTVRGCPTWLLVLPCLPPMTALKHLVVQSGPEKREKLSIPDTLWEIVRAPAVPLLRVKFPVMETLRVSGIMVTAPSFDGRLSIHQSRVKALLYSLPRLKSLDISLVDWPEVIPGEDEWQNPGDRYDYELYYPKVDKPEDPPLSNLADIRLCSETAAGVDFDAFNRIMDVLPIHPGSTLHYETHSAMPESSYEHLLPILRFQSFQPTQMVARQRENRYSVSESEIRAADDDGTARSLLCRKGRSVGIERELPRFLCTGHRLVSFLDSGRLRTLAVDFDAWDVFADGFVAPALEDLTFVFALESIDYEDDETLTFSYRQLILPKLRSVSFAADSDEPHEDGTESLRGTYHYKRTPILVQIPVDALLGLLRAVCDMSLGKIEQVTILYRSVTLPPASACDTG